MEEPPTIRKIFASAIEIEAEDKRSKFLDDACGEDSVLRAEIDGLIQAHRDAGSFFSDGNESTLDETLATTGRQVVLGKQIGPFKLLQQIGEGGMGQVFLAEQQEPVKRRVALKIIRTETPTEQILARFEAERQALAMMDHQNIAKVLDAGVTEDGRPYFAMELVKGIPITEYCDKNRLTPDERLALFLQTCRAIKHAHQKGIIHRDLKPSNVLVTLYDGKATAKVIDFGLAKAMHDQVMLTNKTLFTEYGQVVGTLEYMSPEQAELNALDIDTRSDVYSLGVIMYELLTGSTPIGRNRLRSEAFDRILAMIREEEAPRPSARLSNSGDAITGISEQRRTDPRKLSLILKGDIDWIAIKALEKDRTRRYDGVAAFADDVQRYLNNEPIEARPPTLAYRFSKAYQKHKTTFLAAGTIIVLLVLGVFGTTAMWRVAVAQARIAEQNFELAEQERNEAQRATERANQLAAQEATLAAQERDARMKAITASVRYRRSLAAMLFDNGQISQSLLALLDAYDLSGDAKASTKASALNLISGWSSTLGLRTLHSEPIVRGSLSQDGSRFVASHLDNSAAIWQRRGDSAFTELERTPNRIEVDQCVLAPAGDVAFFAFQDGRALLLDLENQETTELKHQRRVFGSAVSGDSRFLATAELQGPIRIWDLKTLKVSNEITESPPLVTSIKLSRSGHRVCYKGRITGSTQVRDMGNAEPIEINQKFGDINAFEFVDDRNLALGLGDGQLVLWDSETDQEVWRTSIGNETVVGLRCSQDGQFLASRSGNAIHIWNVSNGDRICQPIPYESTIADLAFSEDKSNLIVATNDGSVSEWPLSKGAVRSIANIQMYANEGFVGLNGYDFAKAIDSTAERAIRVNVSGNEVELWDLEDASKITSLDHSRIHCASFSANGDLLITGSQNATVRVWETAKGRPVTRPVKVGGIVLAAAITPDGKSFITSCDDYRIRVHDLSGNPKRDPIKVVGIPFAIACSPDGKWVLTGCRDRKARIQSLQTFKLRCNAMQHEAPVGAVAYSPDGTRVVTGSSDGVVQVWDSETGEPIGQPMQNNDGVVAVEFSPDNLNVLTATEGGVLKIWDAETGFPRGLAMSADDKAIVSARFVSNDRVVTSSKDGMVRQWSIAPILPDEPERIRCWIELQTGFARNPSGDVSRRLSSDEWFQRHQRLQELGGPPRLEN